MIPYDQYHGTGNDFAIVDARADERGESAERRGGSKATHAHVPDRAAFAEHACATLGVDGVLFLAVEAQYTPPRAVMTLVQPDGSTAAMCGNGARCAARWVAAREGAEKGAVPDVYVVLREGVEASDAVRDRIVTAVEEEIGKFARPANVVFVDDLPKTRSGKIMRRLLKDLAEGRELGDVTTLANADIVESLKQHTTAGG